MSDNFILGLENFLREESSENNLSSESPKFAIEPDTYSFIGSGGQAIILFDSTTKSAYKISGDSDEEIETLNRLNRRFGCPRNIISLKKVMDSQELVGNSSLIIMELEYIEGRTLFQHLKDDQKTFTEEEVWKYSTEIFNGLQELRECDIYHRDLWLGNIMIDEDLDRAVIFDLGEATVEPNANNNVGSKRYRGDNDVQTLGQVMYKMATGRNLFNTYPDRCTYSFSKEEILENKRKFNNDNEFRAERLAELNANISNSKLRKTIKTCLTAPCRTDNTNFATDEVYSELKERFLDVT